MKIGIEHRKRIISGILITVAAFLVVLDPIRLPDSSNQNLRSTGATPSSLMAEPLVPVTTLRLFGFALMLNQPPKAFLQ